jgi:N-acetylneuraminate synthase
MSEFTIGNRTIGIDHPTYFIADIAANHDGSLDRALHLMTLAAEAGADCAKFQHFRAETIVSDYGFKALGGQLDHQATWEKSVFEVYEEARLPWEWTPELSRHSDELGIDFMSAPYELAAVDHLDPFSKAFKIGSGDVNWIEELEYVATKGKPVFLATGASTIEDVDRAVAVFQTAGNPLCVMQCNTNYTGSIENLHYVNLNVLNQYRQRYPDAILGLSDHTPGHITVLGGVALGARAIEKHFTDDTTRTGPDHGFSLDPTAWRDMVDATRILEAALGNGIKDIEENERQTSVLQRRCVRAARDLPAGTVISREDLVVLRPAPEGSVPAQELATLIGSTMNRDLIAGQALTDLGALRRA